LNNRKNFSKMISNCDKRIK